MKRVMIDLVIAFLTIGPSFYLIYRFSSAVLKDEKIMIDLQAETFINHTRSPFFDTFFAYMTDLGSVQFITIVSILLATVLLILHRWWQLLFFAMSIIGIGLLTKGLKAFYERERPNILEQFDGTGFSFPSGHSTGAIVLYGYMIYLISQSKLNVFLKWFMNLLLVALINTIGLSRIYLEVHYASDVLAGVALGLIWLITCLFLMEYLVRKRAK